jgi:hypothetical protein
MVLYHERYKERGNGWDQVAAAHKDADQERLAAIAQADGIDWSRWAPVTSAVAE